MLSGAIFLLKGLILTEVLTNALRSWGIFDPYRNKLKSKSLFLQRLLDCFECTSVWAGFFVVSYLLFFEWEPFTFALIFHRLACFLHLGYEFLDASRSVKEGQI